MKEKNVKNENTKLYWNKAVREDKEEKKTYS